MRKISYEVRRPTLEELDASAVRAKEDMDAWREAGEHDLASLCEKAMNRFLEARSRHSEVNSSPA